MQLYVSWLFLGACDTVSGVFSRQGSGTLHSALSRPRQGWNTPWHGHVKRWNGVPYFQKYPFGVSVFGAYQILSWHMSNLVAIQFNKAAISSYHCPFSPVIQRWTSSYRNAGQNHHSNQGANNENSGFYWLKWDNIWEPCIYDVI